MWTISGWEAICWTLPQHGIACHYSDFQRRQSHPTPVLLPGKSHGRRSLVGCSPWCPEELDTTEWLHFHFSLSCIGEGNGNPLHCSCLENPKDGGVWWAAVYGVAQSRTQLKRLSSSISKNIVFHPMTCRVKFTSLFSHIVGERFPLLLCSFISSFFPTVIHLTPTIGQNLCLVEAVKTSSN